MFDSGTHERFIGFLIEHYAGNFPLWLAPDQVRVITLNDDEALINYAQMTGSQGIKARVTVGMSLSSLRVALISHPLERHR